MNETQRAQVEAIMKNIRAQKLQRANIDIAIKGERDALQALLQEIGENYKDGDGYARLTKAGKRITYNYDVLEKLRGRFPVLNDARLQSVCYDTKVLDELRGDCPAINTARVVKVKPPQLQVR